MVLAGSDVWWCDAAEELRRFVETIDTPVFLNAMGRGSLPSDHPNLGSLGRRYGLVKSDTVILIGTPIDFRLSYGEDRLFPQNPKLIEIMMDGNKIGQNRDVDVGVTGDVGAVLGQVLDSLDASGYKSPGKAWVEEVMLLLLCNTNHAQTQTYIKIHPHIHTQVHTHTCVCASIMANDSSLLIIIFANVKTKTLL